MSSEACGTRFHPSPPLGGFESGGHFPSAQIGTRSLKGQLFCRYQACERAWTLARLRGKTEPRWLEGLATVTPHPFPPRDAPEARHASMVLGDIGLTLAEGPPIAPWKCRTCSDRPHVAHLGPQLANGRGLSKRPKLDVLYSRKFGSLISTRMGTRSTLAAHARQRRAVGGRGDRIRFVRQALSLE